MGKSSPSQSAKELVPVMRTQMTLDPDWETCARAPHDRSGWVIEAHL